MTTNSPPVLVFLDFDGVLNTPEYRKAFAKKKGGPLLDPARVALLNLIEEDLHPTWVISSAWRACYSVEEITSLLQGAGFHGTVSDKLKVNVSAPTKREEIYSYLDTHPAEVSARKVAIFDDLNEAKVEGTFFFLVDGNRGLTRDFVERAIKTLRDGS